MIKTISALIGITAVLTGCVVVPVNEPKKEALCEVSTDRKTLKVLNIAKETNTYYSISGVIITPILLPTSAIVSGSYAAVYNVYKMGETLLVCRKPE